MKFYIFLMMFCPLAVRHAAAQLPGAGTETVHSVAHVKPGHEAEYEALSSHAWDLYQKLGLVLDSPHVVLRGVDEKSRPFFVEVFSWKNSSIPDHAPPAVKVIWQQLEKVCEPRDNRPGIDFSEVTVLALK